MDQVTPNLESVPERTYIRTDAIIQCFKILECSKDKTTYSLIISIPDEPIWQLDLLSVDLAIALMNDLYYGEYTGG